MKEISSTIFDLDVKEVNEVLSDIQLTCDEKYKIHYVIDPIELVEFCFPFGLNYKRSIKDEKFETLIDNQIILFNIFYVNNEKPVLLDEYYGEILRLNKTIEYLAIQKNITNQLDELFRSADFDEVLLRNLIKRRGDLKSFIETRFNVLLALAMGIYSEGVDRFRQCFTEKMVFKEMNISSESLDGTQVLDEIFSRSRGTELSREIYKTFVSYVNKENLYSFNGDIFRENAFLRSSYVDSVAIERLLTINNEVKAHKRLKHKFVYLSSALKSKYFFSQEVLGSFDSNWGSDYNVLRNRAQLFAYLLFKDERELLVTRLKFLENKASLRLMDPNHEVKLEAEFRKKIAILRDKYLNQRLFNQYKEYASIINDIKLVDKSEREKLIIHTLKEIFSKGTQENLGSYSDKISFYVSEVKTAFYSIVHSIKKLSDKAVKTREYLRLGRDSVIGVHNILPTIFYHVKKKEYRDILNKITVFFSSLNYDIESRNPELIRQAAAEFLELDAELDNFNLEHDLIRGLLTLAHPSADCDRIAFDFAKDIIENKIDLAYSGNSHRKHKPDITSDFYCMMVWAARRCKNYPSCNLWLENALKLYNEDARFYHARCLNTYAWIVDETTVGPPSKLSLASAVKDATRAIVLYSKEDENRDKVIAALYNSIAYFHILKINDSFSVEKARQALLNLRNITDKSSWEKRHPEYLETEARIEYEEFRHNKGTIKIDSLVHKMQCAKRDISKACEAVPSNKDYINLRDVICEELQKLELKQKNRSGK